MECPACESPLLALEYEGIELDYCPECHGTWLDGGELELLLGDGALRDGFLDGGEPENTKEKARPCPLCGKKMRKEHSLGQEPVLYDHCLAGHGLWFDEGELKSVIHHGAEGPGAAEVLRWLREVFPEQPLQQNE